MRPIYQWLHLSSEIANLTILLLWTVVVKSLSLMERIYDIQAHSSAQNNLEMTGCQVKQGKGMS